MGRSIGQIDIRKRYGINILAVRQNGKKTLTVTPDMVLTESMTLLVLGDRRSMQKCFKI